MKLSAPIYQLKRKAKLMAREASIPLHEALDRIAREEGFGSWSLLAARASGGSSALGLLERLAPGDLVLVGARPGQGKTLMSLELAVEALKAGNRAAFFSLEYTERDMLERFRDIGVDPMQYVDRFTFDGSDGICSGHIIRSLASEPRGTLVVIDYLQLLDQRRENPDLMVQVHELKSFAKERGLILVFISQIARTYDPAAKAYPDLSDVRLPNPLDLKLFDKACFLNNGKVAFQQTNS